MSSRTKGFANTFCVADLHLYEDFRLCIQPITCGNANVHWGAPKNFACNAIIV